MAPSEVDLFWSYAQAEDFLMNPKVDVMMTRFYALNLVPAEYKDRYEKMVADKNSIIKIMFEESKVLIRAISLVIFY